MVWRVNSDLEWIKGDQSLRHYSKLEDNKNFCLQISNDFCLVFNSTMSF